MSYTKGMLIVDASFWDETGGAIAMLPHSCDEWEIGGIKQIDALIKDLQKAKIKIQAADNERTV